MLAYAPLSLFATTRSLASRAKTALQFGQRSTLNIQISVETAACYQPAIQRQTEWSDTPLPPHTRMRSALTWL